MNDKRLWSVIYINGIPTDYLVSTLGEVYNSNTKTFLKGSHDERGYVIMSIYIGKKLYSKKLHRLVAEAFIPNPNKKPTVNHKDGNKEHNYISNLEWATHQENIDHAIQTGLRNINGVNSVSNIYSEKQVHKVCKLLEEGKQPKEISQLLGVSENLPRRIKYNGKWKEISSQYNIPRATKVPLRSYGNINRLIAQNYSNEEILKKLHLPDTQQNRSNISHLRWRYNKLRGSTTIGQLQLEVKDPNLCSQ